MPVFASWRNERFLIGGRELSIRVSPIARDEGQFLADWLDLERRAVEGNMFLSPHFVLPALQHLDPRKRPLQLAIYRNDAEGARLIGLGLFIARPPTVRFPLPHLEAYRSPHTFLTGMLLDRDSQWLALEGLGAYLSSARVQWCGIEFEDRLADGALDQIHQDKAITSMVRWSEYYRHRRAILTPAAARDMSTAVLADGGFGKDLRRKRRRLGEKGEVGWLCRAGQEVTPEVVETFLRLEDQGWKCADGKSMLSRPGHAEFFRDMSMRFAADGRAFFTELTVNGRVIASTSNFISGNIAFAFKIGWDTEFASVSPGLLNELELMQNAERCLPEIAFIDSGAVEGSFIERLWRESRQVATGILTGGYAGAAVLPAISIARRLKRGMA
jgi:CelD/BcsL family acetyltransferase involved in cellulose biosynthesis